MEFKKYLCRVSDAGTRLFLNSGQERMDSMKELGRHRGREDRKE